MRISDWSSDVCSSDLADGCHRGGGQADRDHALHRAGLRAGDRQRLLELAQHETGVMKERELVFRRRDALGRAVPQRLADMVPQLRALLAERPLRAVLRAGGLRRAPDRAELPEVTNLAAIPGHEPKHYPARNGSS